MEAPRIVALVGRPNVGKSRLFNRLAGRRISIVHDQPGVTRDLVTADIHGNFTLMDTGGIGLSTEGTPEAIASAVEAQVAFAIEAATVILFVVDGRSELTPLDEQIADQLREQGKEPLLVVNKIDHEESEQTLNFGPFYKLGFGDPHLVSAEHGRQLLSLQIAIDRALGPPPPSKPAGSPSSRRIQISFVGRPNVGKSSLGNRLLASERLIVSDVPGTTRDAVELDIEMENPKGGDRLRFRLVDTAGLRTKRKVSSSVEYFSTVRTQKAMDRSDVVFLVVDAIDGITRQDQRLAGEIIEGGKALVMVVNKWDITQDTFRTQPLEGYENERDFQKAYRKAARKELFFLPDTPLLFVSAKNGTGIDRILPAAADLDRKQEVSLSTSTLNRVLHDMLESNPPRRVQNKRFKVFYAVQVGNRPFRIRLFCNQVMRLDNTYRRYLEKGIQEAFQLDGCPIQFEFVGKETRYSYEGDKEH